MGCGEGWFLFSFCFLLYFLSWQHWNFGAVTKTPLERLSLDLARARFPPSNIQEPALAPPASCGNQTDPAKPDWGCDMEGRGGIWGKIQRKQFSKSPWSWNILSKSWQAVPALPHTLLAFAFSLGPDFQLTWWARLPSLPKCQSALKRGIQTINNS